MRGICRSCRRVAYGMALSTSVVLLLPAGGESRHVAAGSGMSAGCRCSDAGFPTFLAVFFFELWAFM